MSGIEVASGELMEGVERSNMLSFSKLSDLLDCRCAQRYTIEPHGKGYAVYFGRCRHRHGANIAMITECSRKDIIKFFEDQMNLKPCGYAAKNYKTQKLVNVFPNTREADNWIGLAHQSQDNETYVGPVAIYEKAF